MSSVIDFRSPEVAEALLGDDTETSTEPNAEPVDYYGYLPSADTDEEAESDEFQEAVAFLSDPNNMTVSRIVYQIGRLHDLAHRVNSVKSVNKSNLTRAQSKLDAWHKYYAQPAALVLQAALALDNSGRPKPEKSMFLETGTFKLTKSGGRVGVVDEEQALAWCKANMPDAVEVKYSLKTKVLLDLIKQYPKFFEDPETNEPWYPSGVEYIEPQDNPAIAFEGLATYKLTGDKKLALVFDKQEDEE